MLPRNREELVRYLEKNPELTLFHPGIGRQKPYTEKRTFMFCKGGRITFKDSEGRLVTIIAPVKDYRFRDDGFEIVFEGFGMFCLNGRKNLNMFYRYEN